ncbi:MAG: Gfo/Idh/MocA family oxidoreductase [Fimbriimonadaceae bacterium]|nr:Gfo/Idh/MocA family oxidoreductase [Fimbriimonadaceae bacterium]
MSNESDRMSRRSLLQTSAVAAATAAVPSLVGAQSRVPDTGKVPATKHKTMLGVPFEKHDRVRIGFVGVGGRGTSLLSDFLATGHVDVPAICDIDEKHAKRGADMVEKRGQKRPELYTKGDHDFERLCARNDLDVVLTATPWDWHVPVCLSAMKHGHHAFTEVPAAYTIEDCWALVEASEASRKHCVMIENCTYDHAEMMVLNMVQAGLFGVPLHGGAAYDHDLRDVLTNGTGESLWRRFPHMKRNGNFYPTHGLAPVGNYFGNHLYDRFDYMVSMSSPEAGLSEYVKAKFPEGDPKRKEKYICGDVNTSLIKTAMGKTIMLQHDVSNCRPYSRINMLQGSKGIFEDYPPRIYFDGGNDEYVPLDKYKDEWEHPLWKEVGEMARKNGGHGGMDFIMAYRMVECMRQGTVPDMDVYEAAAWSVPGPLSEISVAHGSVPLKFPDFTRGEWKKGHQTFLRRPIRN